MQTRRLTEGYRIDLSGPMSVLQETRRYGINFARFVTALVSCRDWQMRATVATRWARPATVQLDSAAGYRSHIAPSADYDSMVESNLARQWGAVRDGWRLSRDSGILQYGQTTFVPDFKLIHEQGHEVLLEVVGFWTPEYLAAKRDTLRVFQNHRILLAISTTTAKPAAAESGAIVYRTKIDPDAVVQSANEMISCRIPQQR